MKILKYTDTFEDCPLGCRGKLSYLHDDQWHKTCGGCGVRWNRINNEIINRNGGYGHAANFHEEKS